MTEERSEYILRVKNIPEPARKFVEAVLKPVATRLMGSLSRIDREHHSDHEIHIRRTRLH